MNEEMIQIVKIHDVETGEVMAVKSLTECKTELEKEVFKTCIDQGEVITMGKTIGESICYEMPWHYVGWNRALKGAFIKGLLAGLSGKTRDDCPYKDKRKNGNKTTWSRGFISAWKEGQELAVRN